MKWIFDFPIDQDVKRKLKIRPERTISDEVEEIDRKMMRILERRDTERVERRIIAPEALRQRDPYFRIASGLVNGVSFCQKPQVIARHLSSSEAPAS